MKTVDGGYEPGYQSCDCFWGTEPASLLQQLAAETSEFQGLRVLDVGCGEGKNAAYLSERGAKVVAIELSARALEHARRDWSFLSGIEWICADIRDFDFGPRRYDIVILYGLYHCFETPEQIRAVYSKLEGVTESGGYHVVCCFNSRRQEMAAASSRVSSLLGGAPVLC